MLTKQYIKVERLIVLIFLFSYSINLGHDVSAGWNALLANYALHPPAPGVPYNSLFSIPPVLHAPEAFRIAVPAVGRVLLKLLPHSTQPRVAGLLDFVFCFAALWFFYLVLINDNLEDRFSPRRTATVLTYLALIPFALSWVTFFQRPETMPTTFFLATTLYFLLRSDNHWGWSVALVCNSIWQGFVRADVAIVTAASLVLLSIIDIPLAELGTRGLNIYRGLLMFSCASGVQLYLQFVRFREAHYWIGYPIICLEFNSHPQQWVIALRAMLPFLLIFAMVSNKLLFRQGRNLLLLTSSLSFLPIWFTVGHAEEVRIFVPFLISWCVLCSQSIASCLTATPARLADSHPQSGIESKNEF